MLLRDGMNDVIDEAEQKAKIGTLDKLRLIESLLNDEVKHLIRPSQDTLKRTGLDGRNSVVLDEFDYYEQARTYNAVVCCQYYPIQHSQYVFILSRRCAAYSILIGLL